MAANKNLNEKQPGEKPEGKYQYNVGAQCGKLAENAPQKRRKRPTERQRPFE
jgi:hypothetical protein